MTKNKQLIEELKRLEEKIDSLHEKENEVIVSISLAPIIIIAIGGLLLCLL